jgi:hypothetical protein
MHTWIPARSSSTSRPHPKARLRSSDRSSVDARMCTRVDLRAESPATQGTCRRVGTSGCGAFVRNHSKDSEPQVPCSRGCPVSRRRSSSTDRVRRFQAAGEVPVHLLRGSGLRRRLPGKAGAGYRFRPAVRFTIMLRVLAVALGGVTMRKRCPSFVTGGTVARTGCYRKTTTLSYGSSQRTSPGLRFGA